MKVYLGGSYGNSDWCEKFTPLLDEKDIDYICPSKDEDTRKSEKEECDILLYTITPKLTGMFAIAETIESAILHPDKTIFNVIPVDSTHRFNEEQLASLVQTGKLVVKHGAYFVSGDDVVLKAIESLTEKKKIVGDIPIMINFEQRVHDEAKELRSKKLALDIFIHCEGIFSKLPAVEQELLYVQLAAMQMYLDTLIKRINRFGKKEE